MQSNGKRFECIAMKTSRLTRKKRAREAAFDLPHDLVPHPRARQMAQATHRSVPAMSVEEIRSKAWQTWRSTIVPGTAILPNEALQNYALFPRRIYADLLKQCKSCTRPFVFYANEQRFWYETLRIPVDADCVMCPPCRKHAHRVKAALFRYEKALHAPRLDAKDMKAFVEDALFLLEQGVVRNLARLGAIKNRAVRELADYAGTRDLARALASAREAAEMRPGASRSRHW